MEEGDVSMTAMEAARLIDWLMSNGHTADEATQCIKYIAGTPAPASRKSKKLGSPAATKLPGA